MVIRPGSWSAFHFLEKVLDWVEVIFHTKNWENIDFMELVSRGLKIHRQSKHKLLTHS